MSIAGRIERVEQDCVIGWVYQTPHSQCPLRVKIYANGVLAGEGLAAGLRPDVVSVGGPAASGFEIFLPRSVVQSGALLEARVEDETFSTKQLRSAPLLSDAFAGVVEFFDGKSIRGWAVNIAEPGRPVVLSVYLGGQLIGYCGGSFSRPDIETQFGATTPLGFAFTVPLPLRASGQAVFRFFIANTGVELGGSPFLAGASPLPNDLDMLASIYMSEPSQ